MNEPLCCEASHHPSWTWALQTALKTGILRPPVLEQSRQDTNSGSGPIGSIVHHRLHSRGWEDEAADLTSGEAHPLGVFPAAGLKPAPLTPAADHARYVVAEPLEVLPGPRCLQRQTLLSSDSQPAPRGASMVIDLLAPQSPRIGEGM